MNSYPTHTLLSKTRLWLVGNNVVLIAKNLILRWAYWGRAKSTLGQSHVAPGNLEDGWSGVISGQRKRGETDRGPYPTTKTSFLPLLFGPVWLPGYKDRHWHKYWLDRRIRWDNRHPTLWVTWVTLLRHMIAPVHHFLRMLSQKVMCGNTSFFTSVLLRFCQKQEIKCSRCRVCILPCGLLGFTEPLIWQHCCSFNQWSTEYIHKHLFLNHAVCNGCCIKVRVSPQSAPSLIVSEHISALVIFTSCIQCFTDGSFNFPLCTDIICQWVRSTIHLWRGRGVWVAVRFPISLLFFPRKRQGIAVQPNNTLIG